MRVTKEFVCASYLNPPRMQCPVVVQYSNPRTSAKLFKCPKTGRHFNWPVNLTFETEGEVLFAPLPSQDPGIFFEGWGILCKSYVPAEMFGRSDHFYNIYLFYDTVACFAKNLFYIYQCLNVGARWTHGALIWHRHRCSQNVTGFLREFAQSHVCRFSPIARAVAGLCIQT